MKIPCQLKALVLVTMVSLATITSSNAQTDINSAYSLFLYNFAKYSQWPDQNSENFKITVIGNSKVVSELEKMSKTKKINGKSIKVEKLAAPSEYTKADIIFIAEYKSSTLESILQKTSGKPVLIVTEKTGLFEKGACISFLIGSDHKLKFEINDSELSNRNLKMAQSLKNMAHNS